MFDTDGSIIHRLSFCSSDDYLRSQCAIYLKKRSLKVRHSGKSINIKKEDMYKFTIIGFAHPRKQLEFLSHLYQGHKFTSVKKRSNKPVYTELLSLSKVLRTDPEGYRIRINTNELRHQNINLDQVQELFSDLFEHKFRRAANGMYYFKSKRVYDYLRSVFIYEPAWKPITESEEDDLLISWNDVWRK